MPATATLRKQFPAVVSEAPEAVPVEPDTVEYPEGHWTAQSIWHGDAIRQATVALLSHFSERKDVLVAMELVVYYERGNNKAHLQPDLQVVFGVDDRDRNRRSFKVWEEGKAADFVLEVASPSTAENDARHKAAEYLAIGVREYWRLDPEGSLMGRPLEGYEASGGRYGPMQAADCPGGGRWLRSEVLGLDLGSRRQDGATVVVFRDPLTGEEFDGGLREAERLRRIAEERASAAEERASAAEENAHEEARLRRTAEEQANAAAERIRALEERLGDLAARSGPEASK
ncbi:MAG: Uma2 family endonuclease [Bryobacterales bacterium]|nr:Uma2 family endonuclease [Bryobacterales bacterium]